MAGRGTRQGLAAKLGSDGQTLEFVADKTFRVLRIRLFNESDGIVTFDDKISIEADGQALWSGQSVPIGLVADPHDDGSAGNAVRCGAHVITFDDPLEFSNEFPVKVTLNLAGSSQQMWVALDSIPSPEAA